MLAALFPDASFEVVALAASAGGLHALQTIFENLPANFPAALLVVVVLRSCGACARTRRAANISWRSTRACRLSN